MRNLNIFLLLCALFGMAFSKFCPRIGLEDVDWVKFSQLEATWYDVIDNPQYEYLIDCWDWKSFLAIGDGFAMNATMYAQGRPVEKHLDVYLHFIPNEDGTYSVNQAHKSAYASRVKESISHKADEEMLEAADVVADIIFSAKYFFVTNYKTYFIVAQCDPEEGMTIFVKNRRVRPNGQDILNVWNLLIENEETPREDMVFKQTCINRN